MLIYSHMAAKAKARGLNGTKKGRRPAIDEPTKRHILELWKGGFFSKSPIQVADPRRHKEIRIPRALLPKAGEKPKVLYLLGVPAAGDVEFGSTRLREGNGLAYIQIHPGHLVVGHTSARGVQGWARQIPLEKDGAHRVGKVTTQMGHTGFVKFVFEQAGSI